MSKSTILIADDDKTIRKVLSQSLVRAGYDVEVVATAATLWQAIEQGIGDVLVSDVMMPDQNTFDLIPRIKLTRPDLPIIVISAKNTLATAVSAAELDVFDYLPKPFDLSALTDLVARALTSGTSGNNPNTTQDTEEDLPLVGSSPAMQEIYRLVARLTQNDLSVLIVGESGTGKELVARALHDFGRRKHAPFVAINMAAIPHELIESELFGHEKGAFTGANARVLGRFAQAEGGTLFLDEIGDMPPDTQTRLLRVLQEGEYIMVGGSRAIKTNVRIVAATHQDLRALIRQGLFREDLYFRLNVVPLRLPPLRERKQDISLLVRHFIKQGEEQGLPRKVFDNKALAALEDYDYAGNVRELENLVRRIAALYSEDTITADIVENELPKEQIPPTPQEQIQSPSDLATAIMPYLTAYLETAEETNSDIYTQIIQEVEAPLIRGALEKANGNQLKAARILGINRNTLRKKIETLGIKKT